MTPPGVPRQGEQEEVGPDGLLWACTAIALALCYLIKWLLA